MTSPPRLGVAEWALYAHTTAYSVALGAIIVLVPLYILSLGYHPGWLGAIIAGQGLFQVGLRLFGGVLSDRLGERWVIQASFAALLAGSLGLAFSESVAWLVGSQALFGGSRSLYWTSSQSYGSRIDETRPAQLIGRFFGFGAAGSLVGNAGGGVVAAAWGYQEGFLIAGGLAAAGMVLTVVSPELPRRAARSVRAILAPVPGVFRSRSTALPAIMAFGTSLQVAVLASVGAALMKDFGYGDDEFGILMAVHGIGAVPAGFLFAAMLRRMGERPAFAATMGTHGALLLALAAWGDAYWVALGLLFTLGFAFNAGRVLNVSLTAMASSPEQRGVFMAVVGIYWASGQMLGPLLFGPLAAATSLEASVSTAGVAMAATAVATPALYALFGRAGAVDRERGGS